MTTTPAPIKSDDLPAANCTLPELYVDELEPYQEYSRIEILANLRVLIDRHVLTTVYFDQGASFIITRILGFTADFEELIFDLSPDAKTNEKLQESSDLTMVAFFNHIKVQFTVNRAVLTQFENAPALRVGLPRSLLRLQRRTAFRARTLAANSPDVLLPPITDALGTHETGRLRVADISATGFAFVAPAEKPVLTVGMQLAGCELQLYDNESYGVDIEIRRVSVFKDGFGREMSRVGCRLLRISGSAEMAVQRYVNQLDVAGRSNH
ncbi:MAG: flagellar brake protein [Betaproteobacteria bacterium]|nr:flagellar brake protein [Betaproteobacteria bacterium]